MRHPHSHSRRSFLRSVAATAAVGSLRAAEASSDLIDLSAVEAVARMKRGELSCERYAAALIERCQAMQALNAFITFEPAHVLAAARACSQARQAGRPLGPLFGLPIPVKDSVNTAEYPTTGGTPALRHYRPAEDAPVVQALRASGAIVLGKTNLHELSYGWTSNNQAFGAVHNPYDPKRIPGGSSGGTGAAVAARMAPLGVAEDTEGSIRVPAAFCGIMGFRPTTGRYSTRACVPITTLFDQVGPHARTVADLALFDSVLANDWRPLARVPLLGVRLGIVRDYWYRDLDPEVERITSAALGKLHDAGVELVESELPGLDRLIELITEPVQNHDVRLTLARYLADYDAGVTLDELVRQASPDIRELFRTDVLPGGQNVTTDAAYGEAVGTHLPALRSLYRDYFARYEVAAIIFPATMIPPPPIGAEADVTIRGRTVSFETAVARNIAPGSTAGLSGLVLPAGLTSTGLPVAIELDAAPGSDRALLALGASVATIIGGVPPPRLPASG
jgi:Asp-tRNA(Asn)/Glu-tRNA(Gln) amidotransferase A subunit family amidase